jgi:PKD repeat protein/photosystem II stability/assembly factor-like uncharacterized protein
MKFVSTFALCICTFLAIGQTRWVSHDHIPNNNLNYKPAYQSDYPAWAKMLYQEDAHFFEIADAYQDWKSNVNTTSFKAIERYYKIWRKQVTPYVAPDGSIQLDKVNLYYKNLARQQQEAVSSDQQVRNTTQWEFLGPKETFWLNESGASQAPDACPWQVNVYTFDIAKSNYNTLYCGTETGFVSKSTDNGLSWTLLGQGYNYGGAITALAIHPTDENTVYVGAGQQIHKTTDGGQTWTPQLPSNQLFNTDKLLVDEMNPEKVLAAGSSGVFLSMNGGQSWEQVWDAPSYDVHVKPDDPAIVYTLSRVSGYFSVAISTDGGNAFDFGPAFPTPVVYASGGLLAVSPAAAEELYAILLSENNTPLLYKGNMAEEQWTLLATGQTGAFPMDNWQGFFDLVLEVSPTDPDIIFTGTASLYKSTNGGASFSNVGGYGGAFPLHPDIQCMKLLDDGTAWVSTDGGFTYSTDNFTQHASARNNLLIGSDMWGFDQGWNEDIVVGGRYHNGNTAITDFYQPKALRMGGAESPTGWVMKGKSRQVAFNDLGAGWILPKTATGQPQGRFLFSKYPNMDEYGGRRGNMVFHPNYYELIYLGEGDYFWKSEDMGTSFELIHDFGNRVRFIQIAFDNPDVIYVDVFNRGLLRSEDGGYTWDPKPSLTNIHGTSYWEGKLHFVISPNDANTIYACLSNGTWSADIGKIFKSTDGGNTWEDWSGTLDVLTKTLLIQPDATANDILYLFTTNKDGNPGQCYIRRTGESDWTTYGDNYPASMAPNHALPFFRDSKIRLAGTGGIWETTLDEPNFQPIIQPWVERPFFDCMLDTIQFEDHSILNHDNCTWSWTIEPTPVYVDDANKRNPKVVLGNPGSYSVNLTVIKDGITYTKTIEGMVTTTECPSVDNCNNPGLLSKQDWTLEYVNSEETNYPGYATMAFDDDPGTIWHTRWSTGSDPYPHEMQIDLGDNYDVYEFIYYPRQDGQNGWIKDYELYFSENLDDWGAADTISMFESSSAPHRVSFPTPKVGRYMKIVALSEANGNPWASAAEFEIEGCYHEVVSSQITSQYEQLKAFPVPTQGIFEISLPGSESLDYIVLSLAGAQLASGSSQAGSTSIQLDFSDYQAGVYVVKLVDKSGRSFFVKVVKG